MNIDRTNYEIWLIDYLDGNLSDDQLLLLRKFIKDCSRRNRIHGIAGYGIINISTVGADVSFV